MLERNACGYCGNIFKLNLAGPIFFFFASSLAMSQQQGSIYKYSYIVILLSNRSTSAGLECINLVLWLGPG